MMFPTNTSKKNIERLQPVNQLDQWEQGHTKFAYDLVLLILSYMDMFIIRGGSAFSCRMTLVDEEPSSALSPDHSDILMGEKADSVESHWQ